MSEAAAFLIGLGQQVWQQQELPRDQGNTACLVAIAPFLFGAAVIGLGSLRRALRRPLAPGQQP